MDNNVCNIIFGGIGGQGILKASEICGWAALYEGFGVKKSEVHGMAQRGGSVESHLRFGKKVFSPLIRPGQADYLVCFHKDEHPRLKAFLKADGTDLFDYLDKAQSMIENPRYLNTFLVGVLSAHLKIKQKSWTMALHRVFAKKIAEQNRKVFFEGRGISQL